MKRFPPLLLVLLPLLLPGPASVARAKEPPAAPAGAAKADPDAQALALVDGLLAEVEKARGLHFKEEFARKVLSPREVGKFAMKKMEEELPPERMAGLTRLYARLGFFAPDLDVKKTFGAFLEAGAGGLYDPATKTLYLVRGYPPESAAPILFHELVHALEDQYFDLDERLRAHRDDSDRAAATQAVVEGSAQLLMNRYVAANPGAKQALMAAMMKKAGEQMKMIQSVPLLFVVSIGMYPYLAGPAFVEAATGGETEAIAGLYERPPASTEQVLHPAKYGEGGDPPVTVRLPELGALLPAGWSGPFEDTVGELQLSVLLNEFAGGTPFARLLRMMQVDMKTMDQRLAFQGDAKEAAEGWDGDRAAVYEGPDGRLGLAWVSRWDTPRDAAEFAAAYEKGFALKKEAYGLPDTRRIMVEGDRVVVLEGFPEDRLEGLASAFRKGTKFE